MGERRLESYRWRAAWSDPRGGRIVHGFDSRRLACAWLERIVELEAGSGSVYEVEVAS